MPEEPTVVVDPEPADVSQEKVAVPPAPVVLSEQDQLVAKIRADFEGLVKSQVSQVQQQFDNFRHGAYRIQDDLKKEVERLRAQVKTPSADLLAQTPRQDPWAGIENGAQWKAEIEKLAEAKSEEKLKAWQVQQQSQQLAEQQKQIQETSKQKVIERYPDLHPETGTVDSLVSQTYVKVLNAHPDWLANPYGPELAMYAMEEELKAAPGAAFSKSRAATAALPPSRTAPSGATPLTLTREQKAFCDRHQLKYEDFLKTAAAVEQGAVEA